MDWSANYVAELERVSTLGADLLNPASQPALAIGDQFTDSAKQLELSKSILQRKQAF